MKNENIHVRRYNKVRKVSTIILVPATIIFLIYLIYNFMWWLMLDPIEMPFTGTTSILVACLYAPLMLALFSYEELCKKRAKNALKKRKTKRSGGR